ncbi:MAG: hypothetical protein KAU94_02745 [Verrucomicrobia bacterium]|nr:hypothetical protein [Verrucomicrobiota bacterium]
MPDIDLLRTQKNQVLQSIKNMELDPINFEWTEAESEFNDFSGGSTVPCLKYKGTEYFFIFDMNKGQHYCFYSPGYDKPLDQQSLGAWNGLLDFVWQWLSHLNREIQEPDEWEQLSKFQLEEPVSVDPDTDNLSFTVQEVKQIKDGINNIREYLKQEFDEADGSHDIINEKIDYLIEATNRLGRRDWLHTSIGVFATLGTAISLTPEHGAQLIHLLKLAVNGVIKLLN